MGKESQNSIPLENLLEVLRSSGYELSVQQILEIQSVLLATPLYKTEVDNLKFILTPIIAKTDEDQQALYKLIDSYNASRVKAEAEYSKSIWLRLFKNKRNLFRWKVAGIILAIVAGLVFYLINVNKAEPRESKPEITAHKVADQASPAQEESKSANKIVPKATVPAINKSGVPDIVVLESHDPIIPVKVNFNLQMSAAFGILLGVILSYFIFYQNKTKLERLKRQRETSTESKDSGGKKEGRYGNLEKAEQASHLNLNFPENDYLIQKPPGLAVIKSNLKKPVFIEHVSVDVKRTIKQTISNGGFPTIYYEDPWRERKYVIITDSKTSDAHFSRLLNYFINSLVSAKTPISRYSFTTDIKTLRENNNIVHLENLLHDHRGEHLIIISNCSTFFDDSTLQLKKDIKTILGKWPSKSVITNTAIPDWSYKESQLQDNGFLVVPAEIQAIELLSESLVENSMLKKERIAKRLKEVYSVNQFNFQSVDELKSYLGNDYLFQIVCSLSVYPVLKWPITLALFSSLVNNLEEFHAHVKLDYDTLLKISRIPWLYGDRLEESVRLQLLNSLKPDTEIKAREAMIALLKEIESSTPKDSPAYKELEVQYNLNAFFLYSHDQERYPQYDLSKREMLQYWEHLPEWALKEHINQRKGEIMPTDKHGQRVTVDEFILQETRFEKRDITISKLALLTVPAILLYIIFSVFKPQVVYPADLYKKISFQAIINQDPLCKQSFTKLIADTSVYALNQFRQADTILIENIPYDNNIDLDFWTADSTVKTVTINPKYKYVALATRCE